MAHSIQAYSNKAYHLLKDDSLDDMPVSSKSRWGDKIWFLDNPTHGVREKDSSIRWDIEFSDGSSFVDPKWTSLLDATKRFVWSLMVDPRGGKHLKPGSIGTNVKSGLYNLVRWMIDNHYERFEQLDNAASWEYFEKTVSDAAGDDGDEEITESILWRHLNALALLYKQSEVLEEAGIAPMPEAPFDGRSAYEIASEAATKVRGRTPPFPDEVALPVMSAALRMIGTPASDVIRLQQIYLDAYAKGGPGLINGSGKSPCSRSRVGRLAVQAFEFSRLDGEDRPWREPVQPVEQDTLWKERTKLDSIQVLRRLITDVTAAAVINVQSTTGVRVSEMVALRAGLDLVTGFPTCVRIRKSRTGLNDIFYLRSAVSKIHDGTLMEWVLGSRPADSAYVPPPVRALTVLETLWRPWRELAKSDALILQFCAMKGLPKSASVVAPIRSGMLLRLTKAFVREYGNLTRLPDVLKTTGGSIDIRGYKSGHMVKTRQWRRTFALYVLKTDFTMLPALSQHFKHLSLAMTEEGYIGNDPELIDDVDSVRIQRSVRLFYEAATSKKPMAGRMAELINEHVSELRKLTSGKTKWTAYKAVEAWVLEHDLRIWFTDYGKCFIGLDPKGARCHELAGTQPPLHPSPNLTTREPSVCAGCKCFLVDAEHVDFWKRRYLSNQAVIVVAKRANKLHEYRVSEERAKQAAGVLSALDVTLISPEENN